MKSSVKSLQVRPLIYRSSMSLFWVCLTPISQVNSLESYALLNKFWDVLRGSLPVEEMS